MSQGTQLIRVGQYERALELLLPAFASDATAQLGYAVALCYDGMRDDPMALRFYEIGLRLRSLSPKARTHAKRRVKALKSRLKNRPKKATLAVRGSAHGANVLLDGTHVGTIPLSGLLIPPGRHSLRVVHEGFDPWHKEFTASPWQAIHFDAQMVDKPTDVLVHSEPAGAAAEVKGGPKCVTPCLFSLSMGTYEITLQRAGYQPLVHQFEKPAGQLVELRLRLERTGVSQPAPVAQTKGLMRVSVNQPGATVKVNGQTVGASPLGQPLSLEPGIHPVEVTLYGFQPWQARVEVASGQTTEVNVRLEATVAVQAPPKVTQPPRPRPGPPRSFMPPDSDGGGGNAMWGTGLGLTIGGGVVVGTAIGLTTAVLLNQRKFNTAVRFAIEGQEYVSGLTRQDVIDLEEQSKTLGTASYIMYGVGGAALVTGIILIVLAPDDPPPSKGLVPKLGFTPILGPGTAGAAAEIRF